MKHLILFLFLIFATLKIASSQMITEEYKQELLREARNMQNEFHKYEKSEDKYDLLIKTKKYINLAQFPSNSNIGGLTGNYSFIKHLENIDTFLKEEDTFEEYKYIVVALRLYTEYYGITENAEVGKHIAFLHKLQKKRQLEPYIHYGFYKNDIFNFNIATPGFDYFKNLSVSCYQIEISNNSTNEIDFSRFNFYIQTLDGKIHKEIDLKENKEFYEKLPPMPDGYFFEKIPILSTDRALKLFTLIEDDDLIEKVVMKDTKSDFKIELIFFENIKNFSD